MSGADARMVTVAESSQRKVVYHAKVYVHNGGASEQMIPKLTASAITEAFQVAHPLRAYSFVSIETASLDQSIELGHISDEQCIAIIKRGETRE